MGREMVSCPDQGIPMPYLPQSLVTFLLEVLDVLGFKKRVIRPSCGQAHQMLLTALPNWGDALTLPANEETT